jgi:hypothetical protein
MGFIQRDDAVPTATLLSHARLGMVHQNLPHRSRGNREEMGTALKCPVLLTHHFQISFVDEDRRLKGIARLLLAPHPSGDSMQLGVDHRRELFQGMRFALLQPGKHLGEVILRGHRFEYITDRYAGGNGGDGAARNPRLVDNRDLAIRWQSSTPMHDERRVRGRLPLRRFAFCGLRITRLSAKA